MIQAPVIRFFPAPMWDNWSEWGDCSVTCGVGSRERKRRCIDATSGDTISDKYCKELFGGSSSAIGKCVDKNENCPSKTEFLYYDPNEILLKLFVVDGEWTKWTEWSNCSIFCGKGGKRYRRRYCSNPLPQFGGKKCKGKNEEVDGCDGEHPCPSESTISAWSLTFKCLKS